MNTPFPIPTGLHPSAQGCRLREATLGDVIHHFPQPNGVADHRRIPSKQSDVSPTLSGFFGVCCLLDSPRVAADAAT